jgi:hypothetical protein
MCDEKSANSHSTLPHARLTLQQVKSRYFADFLPGPVSQTFHMYGSRIFTSKTSTKLNRLHTEQCIITSFLILTNMGELLVNYFHMKILFEIRNFGDRF